MAEQQAATDSLPNLQMKIKWIYGEPDHPRLTGQKLDDNRNCATHRINGKPNSGKSALGENMMYTMVKRGATAYDFYQANDNESLVALNGPFKDLVWLVHADDVDLGSKYNTIKISDLYPQRSPGERIYITSKRFYKTEADKFDALLKFTNRAVDRDSWNRVDVLFIREAQKYISSQTKSNQARNKREAADSFADFQEELVHSGYAIILDSQRQMEVAKGTRELTKFWYIKNLGRMEIPREIYWIYSDNTVDFDLDSLRHLSPDQFMILTDNNSIGLGTFEMPSWHIHRGSGVLETLGIDPVDKATGRTIVIEDEELKLDIESGKKQAPVIAPETSPKFSLTVQSRTDARKKTTSEQDLMIKRLWEEGHGAPYIYQKLAEVGWTGSKSSVSNRISVLQARKTALEVLNKGQTPVETG